MPSEKKSDPVAGADVEEGPRFSDPVLCFGFWTGDSYGAAIKHYAAILLSKVMPLFDDLDGEQQRAADDVLNAAGWGPDDYDRAMDAAYEYSQAHVIQFMELRTVFLATGVAGLFHLFEKQLYQFLNRELKRNLREPITKWEQAKGIIKAINYPVGSNGQSALQSAFDNPAIRELHLVANAVKHGAGRSYDELKEMGAPVVDAERLKQDFTVGPHSVFGVDLAIDRTDIERYVTALRAFWNLQGNFWARIP